MPPLLRFCGRGWWTIGFAGSQLAIHSSTVGTRALSTFLYKMDDHDASIAAFSRSVDDIEAHVRRLQRANLAELCKGLGPLEAARIHLMVAYTINTLFYMYLRTQGVSPADHPIQEELERVKAYIRKLKQAAAEESQQSEELTRNAAAAQQFLTRALAPPAAAPAAAALPAPAAAAADDDDGDDAAHAAWEGSSSAAAASGSADADDVAARAGGELHDRLQKLRATSAAAPVGAEASKLTSMLLEQGSELEPTLRAAAAARPAKPKKAKKRAADAAEAADAAPAAAVEAEAEAAEAPKKKKKKRVEEEKPGKKLGKKKKSD